MYSDSFETSQVGLIVGIVFLYTTGVVMFLRNVCGNSAVFNLKTVFILNNNLNSLNRL